MKFKRLKKYQYLGIGTAIGLSAITLAACSSVLVSCTDSKKEDVHQPSNPQPPAGSDNDSVLPNDDDQNKFDATYVFKNAVANLFFWTWLNTLVFDLYKKNNNSLENIIEMVNQYNPEYICRLIISTYPISIGSMFSHRKEYALNNKLAPWELKYYEIDSPLGARLECKIENDNQLVFKVIGDNHDFDARNFNFDEALKFGVLGAAMDYGWGLDKDNEEQMQAIFDYKRAQEGYDLAIKSIKEIYPSEFIEFCHSYHAIDKVTFSLTFPKKTTLRSTCEKEFDKLFTFKNFLPSENDNSAFLSNLYKDCFDVAKDSVYSATGKIMDFYQTQLTKILNLPTTAITATNTGDFKFNLDVELTDEICQILYDKSLDEIKNQIQSTIDYKDEVCKHYNDALPIDYIGLSFIFNKSNPISNDLMGFTIDQKINIIFNDNEDYYYSFCLNHNNSNSEEKHKLFLIQFNQESSFENGDVTSLKMISFDKALCEEFNETVKWNLQKWNKQDLLMALNANNNNLFEIADSKYYNLIHSINEFFLQNDISINVKGMKLQLVDKKQFSQDGNIIKNVTIKIILILNEFKFISFPDDNWLSTSFDQATNQYFLTLNQPIPLSIEYEYINFENKHSQLGEIKKLINQTMSNIKTKISNQDFHQNNDGTVEYPPEINTLVLAINDYLLKNGWTNLKADAYIANENEYWFSNVDRHWKVNFGICFHLVDQGIEDSKIINVDLGRYNDYDSYDTIWDGTNYILLIKNIVTGIPSKLIIPNNIASNLNQILKEFAATLTTEETDEKLFTSHPEVIQKLETELAKIDYQIKVTGLKVNGGWNQQSTSNNLRTVSLGITLNLAETNYYENDILVESDLFSFNQTNHCLCSKENYVTKITVTNPTTYNYIEKN